MNHTGEQREGSKLPIKLGDPTLKGGQTHRAWAPYFVLAVALLLTVLATYYVARTAEAKDQLKFQNAIEDIHDSIHDRLETYIALLRSGSALFSAGGQVSADQFHAFVDRLNLRSNYPGSQGIGFSVRMKPEERDALVASMRRRGVENFRIWPEGERPEYYSIIYLEPLDRRNRVAIGYDMFTEPERRGAMERARDTGHRAASGRVTLVQEIDEQKQAGFLIYVPVYRNGKVPDTVAERQASLEGFIYSPFRANDLLDEILSRQSRKSVDLQIFDGTELTPDHLLYRSNQSRGAADSSSYRPRFTATTTMDVAGRTWSLSFATRPEFDAVASGKGLAPPILLGGTLVSLVLFGVTLAQTRARQVAELPLAGKVMREGAVAEDVKALAEENVPVNHQTALGGLHVLVVDDEPDTLTMLTTILEERRVKVTTASSAGEAIKAIERSTPDILVSDIGMPDADGYELIRAVRRLESKRGGAIPAVALTAYAREEDRMRSLSAGYQIHLAKPVEPSELIAVLAELAGQHPNKPGGNGSEG